MRRYEINPKYHLQHIEESIAEQAKEIERYTQSIKNLEGFLFKLIPFANAVEKISKNFYDTFSSRRYVETVESLQKELKAIIDYLAKVQWSSAHQTLKEQSWIPALENCLPLLNTLLDTQLGQISETVKFHETETLSALNGALNTIKEQILSNITVLAKLRQKHNIKMQELTREKQAISPTHELSVAQQKSKEQQQSVEAEAESGTLEFADIEDVPIFTPATVSVTTTKEALSRASSLYQSLSQLQADMANSNATEQQQREALQMFSEELLNFIDNFQTADVPAYLSEYRDKVLSQLKKCLATMKDIAAANNNVDIAAILDKAAVHLWNAKNTIETQQEIVLGKRPEIVIDEAYEARDENAVIAIALGQELLKTNDINKFITLATVFMSLPENARELSHITDRTLERHALKLIDGINDVVVFDRFLIDTINNKSLFSFELFLSASHKTEWRKLFIQQLGPSGNRSNVSTIHYNINDVTASSPFANANQSNEFVSLLAWIIDSEWIGGLDYFLDRQGLKNQKDSLQVITLTAYTPPPTGTNLEARSPVDGYTFFEYALKNERYQVLAYLIKNGLVPDDAAKKLIIFKSLRDVRKQKLLIKLLLTNPSYFSPVLIELAIREKKQEVLQLLLEGFKSYYNDMNLVCTHLEKAAALDLSIFKQVLDSALKHYRSTSKDMAFLNLLVTNSNIFNLLLKEKELTRLIFLPLLEQDTLSKGLIDSLREIISTRMSSMTDFFELLQNIPQKHFATVLHEIFTSYFISEHPEVLEFVLLAKEKGDSNLAEINALMLQHIENLEKSYKPESKNVTIYNPPNQKNRDTILHRAISRCLPHAYEYVVRKAPGLSLYTNSEGKQPIALLHTNKNWPSIIRDNREERFAQEFAKYLKIELTEVHFWDGNNQLEPLFTIMQRSLQDREHPIPTLQNMGSKHADLSNPDKLRRGDIVVAFCANKDELMAFKAALHANPNKVSLLIISPSLAKELTKEDHYELQQKYRCLGPFIANETNLEILTKTLLISLEKLASYFTTNIEPVKKIVDGMSSEEKQAVEAARKKKEAFEMRKSAFAALSQYIDSQCKKPDNSEFKLWKKLTSRPSKSEEIEAAVKLQNYLLGHLMEDDLKPFYAAFTHGELATVCKNNLVLSEVVKNLSYSGPSTHR